MKLRTQTRISAVLPVAFAAAIGLSLVYATHQVDRVRAQAEAAEAIAHGLFEVNILTREYAQHATDRVVAQWRARHDSLGRLMANAERLQNEELDLLASLKRDHAERDRVFAELHATTAGPWRERLIGQMRTKSQAMDSTARQLAAQHQREVIAVQQRVDALMLGAVVVLAVVLASIQFLLSRTVTHCIGNLVYGIRTFAEGNLTHRIPPGGVTELDAVAANFNDMADQLTVFTTGLQRSALRLEAANKELEAFSYSVSHDLRAPLRAVDGFARILSEEYSGRLDAEGQRLLGVVRDSAQKMGQLIDDLLAFSRLGRHEMASADIDMTVLARDVAEELRKPETARTIEITIAPLPPAHGDPAMVRQVWVNLLSNAIKFTRSRTPAHIEVGGRAEGRENVYWIKDDGVGFDMQYVGKLFGVFQRLHGPQEFEGTGVGLALVQRIVHRHDGRIWAEAQLNEGATFCFALPNKLA